MTIALTPQLNIQPDATLRDLRRAVMRLERDKGVFLAYSKVIDSIAADGRKMANWRTDLTGVFTTDNGAGIHEPFARSAISFWMGHRYVKTAHDSLAQPFTGGVDERFDSFLIEHLSAQRAVLKSYQPLREIAFRANIERWLDSKAETPGDPYFFGPAKWSSTQWDIPAVDYLTGLGVLEDLHLLPHYLLRRSGESGEHFNVFDAYKGAEVQRISSGDPGFFEAELDSEHGAAKAADVEYFEKKGETWALARLVAVRDESLISYAWAKERAVQGPYLERAYPFALAR